MMRAGRWPGRVPRRRSVTLATASTTRTFDLPERARLYGLAPRADSGAGQRGNRPSTAGGRNDAPERSHSGGQLGQGSN